MHAEPNYVRTCLEAGARGYLLKNAMDLELVAAVQAGCGRRAGARSALVQASGRRRGSAADSDAELEVLQLIVHGKSNKEIAVVLGSQREHGIGASREHHAERCGYHNTAELVVYAIRNGLGEHRVTRRISFLAGVTRCRRPRLSPQRPGFRLADVTAAAGIDFHHNSGAFGAKYLPETMGPGCAFLDYDGDGWLDILLVNGMDWPGHKKRRSTPRLYRNNRNGTFTDVTQRAGLAVEMYGMGVAVADYNNDGFPDILITAVGQNRLFQNTGQRALSST